MTDTLRDTCTQTDQLLNPNYECLVDIKSTWWESPKLRCNTLLACCPSPISPGLSKTSALVIFFCGRIHSSWTSMDGLVHCSFLWMSRHGVNPSYTSYNFLLIQGAIHYSRKTAFTSNIQQLTNRLELLFLTVLALPKASSRGFDSRMTSFTLWTKTGTWEFTFQNTITSLHTITQWHTRTHTCTWGPPPETLAMYCMMYLAATVLPAPLSPLFNKEKYCYWFISGTKSTVQRRLE